ncbi:unnamed protein product [Symbiodinium natans]|uniref:Uncharacterized protein n=1 Tax=Symbiodinium natans TaxID=878477 RepID=A0A812R0G4_9DINO|nr:unnamed protein product [Symbiodinium natans]
MCDGCGCNRPAKITATVGAFLVPMGVALYITSCRAWSEYRSITEEKELAVVVEGKRNFTLPVSADLGGRFAFYSDDLADLGHVSVNQAFEACCLDRADCQARAQSIHIRQTSGLGFHLSADCVPPTATLDWKGQQLLYTGTLAPEGQTPGDFQVSAPNPVWVRALDSSVRAWDIEEERKIYFLDFCGHVLVIGGAITLFVSLCLMCCCQPPKPVDAREVLLALHQVQPAQTVQAPVAVATPFLAERVNP